MNEEFSLVRKKFYFKNTVYDQSHFFHDFGQRQAFYFSLVLYNN